MLFWPIRNAISSRPARSDVSINAPPSRNSKDLAVKRIPPLLSMTTILIIAAPMLCGIFIYAEAASDNSAEGLAVPESFASIADIPARSAALFAEAAKVFTHPRCMNCHPAGDRPRQGDAGKLHQPPVARGGDGFGRHQRANFEPGRVPGEIAWRLAPREMGWVGKTLTEICMQIKDPALNGGRTLDGIVRHVGTDHLVGWAWAPGGGRQPPPGSQNTAAALLDAWVKTGAFCPN